MPRMMRPGILGGLALLSACAPAPLPVLGQPGPQKSPPVFQSEEVACRQEAARAASPEAAAQVNANEKWTAFFTAYAKCQSAHGNSVVPVTWPLAYAAFLGGALPFAAPGPFGPVYSGPPGPVAYP